MASLSQTCSASSASPLLLARKVFSLASLLSIWMSRTNPRHYSSFIASASVPASASGFLDTKEVRSTDLVMLEYAELNLKDKISGELGHVRIRQHVNPLSSSFSMPAPIPDWNEVFKDPSLPLMVDIGSGNLFLGRTVVEAAEFLAGEAAKELIAVEIVSRPKFVESFIIRHVTEMLGLLP